MNELEEVSLNEYKELYGEPIYPSGIKTYSWEIWNACLSRMTPIIEQRERERLAKLADSVPGRERFGSLTSDEILAGKLED